MYDLIDRPVVALPVFEREVLDRMRRWVHALTLAGHVPVPLPADAPFDAAMRALDGGSTDTMVFQRPCHSTVEETEAVVLGLWRLVRADRIGAARAAAGSLVDGGNAAPLVTAMIGAVAALAVA